MQNPLPPCPGTPNCERESRTFPGASPEALFEQAQDALGDLGPVELAVRDEGERRVAAVFRVALIFKDDVAVAVTPPSETSNTGDTSAGGSSAGTGAVLHIRSASRVGTSDLGVNARRVKRFFERLDARL
ncbi:MAG: DUF1499 domain-containing protein [Bacteroidetes bacterium QS_9_68_14]|nr:MAG: DUF1499 domain-containing protein [Bacteroidetes bacterium QS_9_68_14]